MICGYARVSTREQNEARQLDALTAAGIARRDIYLDKQSGKDFDRPYYKRLLPSKKYREYEEAALWCLQRKEPITTPVNVQCLFYMPTKRKVDKSNLEEACHDLLVIAGVLADDNRDIIAATDGSRVLYDKENPRTEIYITDYKGAYEQWQHR